MDREIRQAYCKALIDIANKDERLVVLEADLMKATGTTPFKDLFPERLINVGIAEANMLGISAGLCIEGYIPFAATFGCFASRRAFDQFYLSGNYAKLNVKLVGTDPGVTAAFNGGTHMPFEDIGLMRMIPNLIIVEPSDTISTEKLTKRIFEHEGCVYLRLHRRTTPQIYSNDEEFELGKGKILIKGTDITLIGLGALMMNEVLEATKILDSEGIKASVIDALSVKPLDKELIRKEAENTGILLTCENHQINGGLGSAVAELILDENIQCKLGRIGINDQFGQVGTENFLKKTYNITAADIAKKAKSLLKRI